MEKIFGIGNIECLDTEIEKLQVAYLLSGTSIEFFEILILLFIFDKLF